MLPEDKYYTRLMKEAEIIKREHPTFRSVDGNIDHYKGFLAGTGIYKGGYFCIEIKIPRTFPFKPPIVVWNTPIYHPNFYKDRICVRILKQDWLPRYSIVEIIRGVQLLLSNPNAEDPMNRVAADLLKSDKDSYKEEVRRWVELYAGKDQECLDSDHFSA